MPELKQSQWVVMFADMVNSTAIKYMHQDPSEEITKLIVEVFRIIRDQCDSDGAKNIKFTGDGAMAIYKRQTGGCEKALRSATRILQRIEHLNMQFRPPRVWIRLRIGIATGECHEIGGTMGPVELTGRIADLANRLCGEADPDTILIDQPTKDEVASSAFKFSLCTRPLFLKGVSIPPSQNRFYFLEPRLLFRSSIGSVHTKGLLALYPDRASLKKDFDPVRIVDLAASGSTILIAGRTLVSWSKTQVISKTKEAAKSRSVNFSFLILSEFKGPYLPDEEINAHFQHLRESKRVFKKLRGEFARASEESKEEGPLTHGHFEIRETDVLFLDGITCATITLPVGEIATGDEETLEKLIILHDVNAATFTDKACLLLACTCGHQTDSHSHDAGCMAFGLYKRTMRIYSDARPIYT